MLLQNILKKGNNNLDFFRLIAACMVIFGHAYALLPGNGIDPIGKLLRFDYSGSLAVKIFFFISGMLVTSSLIEKQNISKYISSRLLRIWPGLIVVLVITAFILGPLFSTLATSDYFSNPETYKYFFNTIIMQYQVTLPGVFTNHAIVAMNGSLWTIPLEVFAYILLGSIFVMGAMLKKTRPIILIASLFIIINQLFGSPILFSSVKNNLEIAMLGPCFAIGAIFAVFKEKIDMNPIAAVMLWIGYFIFRRVEFNYYFFYLAMFYTILFISSLKITKKLKLPFDPSYGIYLWGWPVQQIMIYYFSKYGIIFNQISSIIIAITIGCLSWILIEKKFMSFGQNIFKKQPYVTKEKK
jgi:peptidoglycan/LPS O-acetylase OafA/YrhL